MISFINIILKISFLNDISHKYYYVLLLLLCKVVSFQDISVGQALI